MIEIDISPNLVTWGTFVLAWHGMFSFIAVATAVYLVGRWAPAVGVDSDDIYSIAIWAIIGGVVGARLVHVIDNWSFYQSSPGQIIAVWSGGIAIWGGVLGGFIGGTIYALWAKHPVGVVADLTAPALVFVQAIGRLGDIANGEHCAKATDFALGFIWTNPVSDARNCPNDVGVSVHPAIAYEIIWNVVALAIIWRFRGRLKPDGMLFALYLALYAVGRFGVQFFREDNSWALGLQQAQYIAILILLIAVPLLAIKARFAAAGEVTDVPRQRGTRAQRRRRGR